MNDSVDSHSSTTSRKRRRSTSPQIDETSDKRQRQSSINQENNSKLPSNQLEEASEVEKLRQIVATQQEEIQRQKQEIKAQNNLIDKLEAIFHSPNLCAGISSVRRLESSKDMSWKELQDIMKKRVDEQLENEPDLVDLLILDVNPQTAVAVGQRYPMSSSEVSGIKHIKPSVPPQFWNLWVWKFLEAASKPKEPILLEYSRYNQFRGTVSWLSGPIMYFADNTNGDPLLSFVWTDITAYKLALQELEIADKAKSALFATISHEYRTPLSGILGLSTLLIEDDPGNLRQEQLDHLTVLRRCGDELLRLVDSVLLAAKLENNMLTLELAPVDLPSIANYVISLVRARNVENTLHDERYRGETRKPLTFDFDIATNVPHRIISDEGSLKTMLLNLLSNAAKFSPNGGAVTLKIRLLKTITKTAVESTPGLPSFQGTGVSHTTPLTRSVSDLGEEKSSSSTSENTLCQGWIEFRVIDHGVGIPKDKLDQLFKPFTQLDATQHRRFEGTGLGLSIVHSLATALGGKVGVQSDKDGSEFWFCIPCEESPYVESNTVKEVVSPLSIKEADLEFAQQNPFSKLLCVEDNLVTLSVLVRFLEKLGYKPQDIDTAKDGVEGLEKLKQNDYDVVLCDVHMPRMTGTELCSTLRQMSRFQPAFLALSASALDLDKRTALESGADLFVSKPLTKSDLKISLQQAHEIVLQRKSQ